MIALLLLAIQPSGLISPGTVTEASKPEPELFAPGIVSTDEYSETGCTFTPDGQWIYFTRSGGGLKSPTIFRSRLDNGKWTKPEKAPLEGFGPHISPDGERIFISKHGYDEKKQRTAELWFAAREGGGWGPLKYHGRGNRPSVAESGDLYFIDRSNEDDRGVIVVQRLVDGGYGEPEILVGGVNTPSYEAHPCIAMDESYVVFDSDRPGGHGEGDLYVSFRKSDGTWGRAMSLGPAINTDAYEAYSSISPDGKYLYYSSDKDGSFSLYRVDMEVIERMREWWAGDVK